MIHYFQDAARWRQLDRVIHSWIGTPYRHMTVVRGRGADCTLFIGACWKEVGVLTDLVYDYYPKDWYKHAKTERVLDGLYRHFRDHAAPGLSIQRSPPGTAPVRGDVLSLAIMSPLKVSNHAAIYVGDDKIVHASPKLGVVQANYGHWIKPFITNVFSVMKEE